MQRNTSGAGVPPGSDDSACDGWCGLKGRLRGWKIVVADHPDDEGPNDDLAVKAQHHRDLLRIHRSSEMAEGLYRRLGFQEYCRLHIYN
jgi:hypothetical protein